MMIANICMKTAGHRTMTYSVILPSDFDEYGWEVEKRGWFDSISVESDGLLINLSFYDPARLKQEIEDAISGNRIFFERNITVVSVANRDSIEAAVKFLYESGELGRLKLSS
jgi:hypothetical protein